MIQIKPEAEFDQDLGNVCLKGIYRIPEGKYNQAPGLRQSDLKAYQNDPEEFAYNQQNQKPSTPAQIEGSIIDGLLTGGDKVRIAPAKLDSTRKNANAWKDWASEQGPDVYLLKECEATGYHALKDKITASPMFQELIGELNLDFAQVSVFWTMMIISDGEMRRVLCKARIDYLDPNGRFALDFKKTVNVTDREWLKANRDYRHYCQQGWYVDGLSKHLKALEDFYFCTFKKDAPYSPVWRRIQPHQAEIGLTQLKDEIPNFIKSAESNNYPSIHPTTVQALELPDWSMRIKRETEDTI